MQTIGILTVLVGLILTGVAAAIAVGYAKGSENDWIVDGASYGASYWAAILLVVGIIFLIVGRARKGGPM